MEDVAHEEAKVDGAGDKQRTDVPLPVGKGADGGPEQQRGPDQEVLGPAPRRRLAADRLGEVLADAEERTGDEGGAQAGRAFPVPGRSSRTVTR